MTYLFASFSLLRGPLALPLTTGSGFRLEARRSPDRKGL